MIYPPYIYITNYNDNHPSSTPLLNVRQAKAKAIEADAEAKAAAAAEGAEGAVEDAAEPREARRMEVFPYETMEG